MRLKNLGGFVLKGVEGTEIWPKNKGEKKTQPPQTVQTFGEKLLCSNLHNLKDRELLRNNLL